MSNTQLPASREIETLIHEFIKELRKYPEVTHLKLSSDNEFKRYVESLCVTDEFIIKISVMNVLRKNDVVIKTLNSKKG